jgi:hypothetical protein
MDLSEKALQGTVLHRRIVSQSPTEPAHTYVIGSFHCERDWFLWSLDTFRRIREVREERDGADWEVLAEEVS